MEIPSLLIPFFERLRFIAPDQYDAFVASLAVDRQTAFRVNTLKASEGEVISRLQSLQVLYAKVPGFPSTFISPTSEKKTLIHSPLWTQGQIAIQSLSSQLVSILLDPKPDELILDACASPGSKTSHIAALMGNTGNIVANDVSWARVGKLKDVCDQLGVTNMIPVNLPAEVLWRDYENTFDRAVVDVPCTMEGRIQLTDPDTYSDWSVKKIKRLSIEQKGILRSAVRCIKPGGTLLYSTCTLAPEENEEVIDWILEKDPSLAIEPLSAPNVPLLKPVMEWQGKTFNSQVQHCLRIMPDQKWEGFFVAKLRRTD
jgi:16S rRNA (cytosine1407-C5)-methyltransferase